MMMQKDKRLYHLNTDCTDCQTSHSTVYTLSYLFHIDNETTLTRTKVTKKKLHDTNRHLQLSMVPLLSAEQASQFPPFQPLK